MSEREHGTYARAAQHRREGEKHCDECREAFNQYMRDYRNAHPDYTEAGAREVKLRQRALTILAKRHRAELLEIINALRKAAT